MLVFENDAKVRTPSELAEVRRQSNPPILPAHSAATFRHSRIRSTQWHKPTHSSVNAALNFLMTARTAVHLRETSTNMKSGMDSPGTTTGKVYGLTDGHSGGDFTKWPQISQSALDFCSCLWLAVQQGVALQRARHGEVYRSTKDANGIRLYTDRAMRLFCEVRRRLFDSRLIDNQYQRQTRIGEKTQMTKDI